MIPPVLMDIPTRDIFACVHIITREKTVKKVSLIFFLRLRRFFIQLAHNLISVFIVFFVQIKTSVLTTLTTVMPKLFVVIPRDHLRATV